MGLHSSIICAFVFALVLRVSAVANNRPIVGILDQPSPEDFMKYGDTYLPASYVKWVENSGARVVPVSHKAPRDVLRKLFSSLNGILFTENTTYYQTASFLFDLATEAFQQGDYFPLWGTCQGFQLLSILGAKSENVLLRDAYDSENLPLPLHFTDSAPSSRMFGRAPRDVIKIFAYQNVTINLHVNGVMPNTFKDNSNLAKLYNLLSVNWDRKGKPFGSTFEGKELPIYGVQYHPERNQYEWDVQEHLEHTSDAVRAMQYLADFFGEEIRKNDHHFETVELEHKALIYNWNPLYTLLISTDEFPEQQTYLFNNLDQYFVHLFSPM